MSGDIRVKARKLEIVMVEIGEYSSYLDCSNEPEEEQR